MPQIQVFSAAGAAVSTLDVSDRVFDAPENTALVHQAVVAYLANQRQGTAKVLTRGEVSGGGKKPYRQKGTGRARQGSRRAPHFTGGGVVFGPHPRSYAQRLPRKMKRLALRGALTAKLGGDAIRVLDAFGLDAIRTKDLLGVLDNLKVAGRVLIVSPARDERLDLSARNLARVVVLLADSLNVVDLLNADTIVIEQPALARLEEVYA